MYAFLWLSPLSVEASREIVVNARRAEVAYVLTLCLKFIFVSNHMPSDFLTSSALMMLPSGMVTLAAGAWSFWRREWKWVSSVFRLSKRSEYVDCSPQHADSCHLFRSSALCFLCLSGDKEAMVIDVAGACGV